MICMIELGQLEAQHEQFDACGVRIVAASLDGLEDSARTQQRFPHLTIVSDKGQGLARAADVVGIHHGPNGEETVSPTTVLFDRQGRVRWVFRPQRYLTRLSPAELLAAIDEHLRNER
jgi:peroxiredoxin